MKRIHLNILVAVCLLITLTIPGCAGRMRDAATRAEKGPTGGVEKFSPFAPVKKDAADHSGERPKSDVEREAGRLDLLEKEEKDAFLNPGIFKDEGLPSPENGNADLKKSDASRNRVFIPSYVDEHNVFHGKRYIYFTIE